MKTLKSYLPALSLLKTQDKKYDYVDSFESVLVDKNNSINPQKVARAFFTSSPKWVDVLLSLRNKIVSPFGLKTSRSGNNRQTRLAGFKCEQGEQVGLFTVFNTTPKEVVIGADDKHLNFRVSLFLEQNKNEVEKKNITMSTTVEFNNWLGRFYFSLVRRFHRLIAPIMLKRIIKKLEKQHDEIPGN